MTSWILLIHFSFEKVYFSRKLLFHSDSLFFPSIQVGLILSQIPNEDLQKVYETHDKNKHTFCYCVTIRVLHCCPPPPKFMGVPTQNISALMHVFVAEIVLQLGNLMRLRPLISDGSESQQDA